MLTAVAVTVLFFPVYLWIRRPFFHLPLHIDTGFYVSNHTIATGRWDFRQGWNAHFAGCSKLIPEWFYTRVYLWCVSRGSNGDFAPRARIAASVWNYVTAIAIGYLAFCISGQPWAYTMGLVLFALLSSEPHWGGYFECGELFEVLPQVAAIIGIAWGLEQHQPWWIALAAFWFAAEVFFVKLSSAPTWLVMFGGLFLIHTWTLLPSIAGGLTASMLYVAWLLWNGRNPASLFRGLRGHEADFDPGLNAMGIIHRLGEKFQTAFRVMMRQPVIPLLGIYGAMVGPDLPSWVWLWFAGAVATYLAQSTDCRYYLIPLMPLLVLPAVAGTAALAEWGAVGWLVLGLAGAAWFARTPSLAAKLSPAARNAWCWRGFRPGREANRNLALEQAAKQWRPHVAGRSLLVYGPCNQAYALLNASYVTPVVAPETYLDAMCPAWQPELNRRLVAAPPQFVLDTNMCFDAQAAREQLGVDFRLTHVLAPWFRLFERVGSPLHSENMTGQVHPLQTLRTFHPQSQAQLEAEERRAGPDLVRHSFGAEPGMNDAEPDSAAELRRLLDQLHERGYRRLAIYGAGRFTQRHAEIYRSSPAPVTLVLDDQAARLGERFLDWPVRTPCEAEKGEFDAIVVSSDRFAELMKSRIRRRFGNSPPAFTLTD